MDVPQTERNKENSFYGYIMFQFELDNKYKNFRARRNSEFTQPIMILANRKVRQSFQS